MSIVAREYFNGQPISLLEHDNDIFFHALSVAKAMNYQEPQTAVRDFINRRQEIIQGSAVFVETLGQGNLQVSDVGSVPINYANATGVFLNAESICLFVDYSEVSGAIPFKKWFAQINHQHFIQEQKQKQMATNPLTMIESLNTQMAYAIEIFHKQEGRIALLEDVLRVQSIDRHQAFEIKKGVQNIAYIVAELEGREKPSRIHFTKIWTTFNNTFEIPSYKDLPKARFAEAVSLLDTWKERFEQELVQ